MENKVVIITGASGGIGESLSRIFASKKFRIVLAARNIERLEEVRSKLEKSGAEVLCVNCDVSREEDCKKLIDETITRFGSIDILINNAGISMRARFYDVSLDVIRKVMDVNFWGTVYCTKYALPYLLESKGSIVGISSVAGKKGLPGRTGYSASKFAMEGFLETVRTENLKNHLHVLIACPGFTASGIRRNALNEDGLPQGESPRKEEKMMSSEKVAEFIYEAVVKRKRDLILTFDGKLTVFLNKFFPVFMDRMVYNHMAKEENSPFK
jgi:short-subunit dehydrogenase